MVTPSTFDPYVLFTPPMPEQYDSTELNEIEEVAEEYLLLVDRLPSDHRSEFKRQVRELITTIRDKILELKRSRCSSDVIKREVAYARSQLKEIGELLLQKNEHYLQKKGENNQKFDEIGSRIRTSQLHFPSYSLDARPVPSVNSGKIEQITDERNTPLEYLAYAVNMSTYTLTDLFAKAIDAVNYVPGKCIEGVATGVNMLCESHPLASKACDAINQIPGQLAEATFSGVETLCQDNPLNQRRCEIISGVYSQTTTYVRETIVPQLENEFHEYAKNRIIVNERLGIPEEETRKYFSNLEAAVVGLALLAMPIKGTKGAAKALRPAAMNNEELVALKVNKLAEDALRFPSKEEIQRLDVVKLHTIWSRNNETLLGVIAKEKDKIPSFGLHGTGHKSFEQIFNYPLEESFPVVGVRYTSNVDPITLLADLHTLIAKSGQYMAKHGGRVIVDISNAKWKGKPIAQSHRPPILLNDSLQHKVFLDLVGRDVGPNSAKKILQQKERFIRTYDMPNADSFALQITPSNFKSTVLGAVPKKETLYPLKEFIPIISDSKNPRGILLHRFKHQELILRIFEQLDVVNPETAPWTEYRIAGKKIMEYPASVTNISLDKFYEMHRQFLNSYANNAQPIYLKKFAEENAGPKHIPKRGEIYWTDLEPAINSTAEGNKVRPCLVLSNNIHNQASGGVQVAPLTTHIPHLYPHDAATVLQGKVAKIELSKSRSADKTRLIRKIHELSPEEMSAVDRAIEEIFGLKPSTASVSERQSTKPLSIGNVERFKKDQ